MSDDEADGERRTVDVRAALHTAGQELHLLDAEEVADSAPVLFVADDDDERTPSQRADDAAAQWSLRGLDPR